MVNSQTIGGVMEELVGKLRPANEDSRMLELQARWLVQLVQDKKGQAVRLAQRIERDAGELAQELEESDSIGWANLADAVRDLDKALAEWQAMQQLLGELHSLSQQK
jgi:hypothetical protein